jgi:hypothetical protein
MQALQQKQGRTKKKESGSESVEESIGNKLH